MGIAVPREKLLDLQGAWVPASDLGSDPLSTIHPAHELREPFTKSQS